MFDKMVRFLKIGADPEFLFGKCEDETIVETRNAAETFSQDGGAVRGAAQIGCDGHTYTGELRPPPAHNVRLLMHNIAALVRQTSDFATTKNLALFAAPVIGDEVLGGHIHLSVLLRGPDLPWELNWSMDGRARQKDDLLLDHLAQSLNYLLIPLEFWFHSPPLQRRRFGSYPTGATDVIRNQRRKTTGADLFFHFEYRSPSTWLSHPAVAYLYLGLAKLTMLNFEKIPLEGPIKPTRDAFPHPYEIFVNRLEELLPRARITPDLRNLEEALEFVDRNRRKLNRPYHPIDVEAWRQVLLREVNEE